MRCSRCSQSTALSFSVNPCPCTTIEAAHDPCSPTWFTAYRHPGSNTRIPACGAKARARSPKEPAPKNPVKVPEKAPVGYATGLPIHATDPQIRRRTVPSPARPAFGRRSDGRRLASRAFCLRLQVRGCRPCWSNRLARVRRATILRPGRDNDPHSRRSRRSPSCCGAGAPRHPHKAETPACPSAGSGPRGWVGEPRNGLGIGPTHQRKSCSSARPRHA